VHILFVETDARFAAVLLSHCFRESALVSEGSQTCYPHICFVGDDDVFGAMTVFNLMADHTDVTSCTDIITAVTACFSLYWLFDIQYPKHFHGILTFLDTYVFRKRSVRVTQKVSTFINKL